MCIHSASSQQLSACQNYFHDDRLHNIHATNTFFSLLQSSGVSEQLAVLRRQMIIQVDVRSSELTHLCISSVFLSLDIICTMIGCITSCWMAAISITSTSTLSFVFAKFTKFFHIAVSFILSSSTSCCSFCFCGFMVTAVFSTYVVCA